MIEMTVHRVGMCAQDGAPVVILREKLGDRFLPVRVSTAQANAVMRHSHRMPPFRPQTHEVCVAAIQALGAIISAAYLDSVDDGTFAARLALQKGERTFAIPATWADAVVLAVRGDAAIYAAPSLLEQLAKAQPRTREPVPQIPPTAAESQVPATTVDKDPFRQFIDSLASIDELKG